MERFYLRERRMEDRGPRDCMELLFEERRIGSLNESFEAKGKGENCKKSWNR